MPNLGAVKGSLVFLCGSKLINESCRSVESPNELSGSWMYTVRKKLLKKIPSLQQIVIIVSSSNMSLMMEGKCRISTNKC